MNIWKWKAEQRGEKRAECGKRLIEDLSDRLTDRYGKGFSTTNLGYFRRFYITFHDRSPAIRHSMGGELPESKSYPAGSELVHVGTVGYGASGGCCGV